MTGHILFPFLLWFLVTHGIVPCAMSGFWMVSSAGLCVILDAALFPLCHSFQQCFHHVSVLVAVSLYKED